MDLSKNIRFSELVQWAQSEGEAFKGFVNEAEVVLEEGIGKMNKIVEHREGVCEGIKENIHVKRTEIEKMREQVTALREKLATKSHEATKIVEEFEKSRQKFYELKDFKFEKSREDCETAKKKLEILKVTTCLYINISKIRWDSESGYSGKMLKQNQLIKFNLDENEPKPERINKIWSLICS